jgi:DNA-binding transcriptional LysR family regulator
MNINRVDLNLLVVFDAVARTRSVSAAAERLALSQPAVSHALNRLRDVMHDPLFIRSRGQLVLTPRADALVDPVREILAAVTGVLTPDTFDPATSTRVFRIGASEYAMSTVVPSLVRALRSLASATSLEVIAVGERTLAQLESGELDCAFWGAKPPDSPFLSSELFRERFIGVVCARHPIAIKAGDGAITLHDYLAFPHVMVGFRDPRLSPVDATLAEMGRSRKVGVVTPSFASNVASLRGTDLVMSIPSRLASSAAAPDLVMFDLPLDVPDYAYSLVWHQRTATDAACRWLSGIIRGSVGSAHRPAGADRGQTV